MLVENVCSYISQCMAFKIEKSLLLLKSVYVSLGRKQLDNFILLYCQSGATPAKYNQLSSNRHSLRRLSSYLHGSVTFSSVLRLTHAVDMLVDGWLRPVYDDRVLSGCLDGHYSRCCTGERLDIF